MEHVKNIQERPFVLLEQFSQGAATLRLSELSKQSGLAKATCLRALKTLMKYGYIQRDGDWYRLGTHLIEMGYIAQQAYPPRQLALPYMEQLRQQTKQSVQWMVREDLEGVYIEVLESLLGVRLDIKIGRRLPLYAGAASRLLLSFADKSVREALFRQKREKFTSNTPITQGKLQSLLAETQEHRLAASFGEAVAFSAELAAPVFNVAGEVIAAISVAGASVHYCDTKILRQYLQALESSAISISRAIGFKGAWPSHVEDFLNIIKERMPIL